MKQTNNAVTFLNSSYRAVLKHAYFTGIASSFIAGMAASPYAVAETVWGDNSDVLISGNGVTETITNEGKKAANLTVENLGRLDFSVNTPGQSYALNVKENLTVNNAYLNVTGHEKSDIKVKSDSLSLNRATVSLKNAKFEYNNANFSGSSVTIGGKTGNNHPSLTSADIYLNYSGLHNVGTATDITEINGGSQTLDSNAVISTPGKLLLSGSNKLVFNGDAADNYTPDREKGQITAKSLIRASDISLNNTAQISVAEGKKAGAIFADSLNLNTGSSLVLNSGSKLQIAGSNHYTKADGSAISGIVYENEKLDTKFNDAKIALNAGSTVTNNGTLTVGAVNVDVETATNKTTLSSAKVDMQINGGNLTNNSVINIGESLNDAEKALLQNSETSGSVITVNSGTVYNRLQSAKININADAALNLKGGNVINNGSIDINDGGRVNVDGLQFSNNGKINVKSGGIFSLKSGSLIHSGNSLINNESGGTVQIHAAAVTAEGANTGDLGELLGNKRFVNKGTTEFREGAFTAGTLDGEMVSAINSGNDFMPADDGSAGTFVVNNAVLMLSGDLDTSAEKIHNSNIDGGENSVLRGNKVTYNNVSSDDLGGFKKISAKDLTLAQGSFVGLSSAKPTLEATGTLDSKTGALVFTNANLRLGSDPTYAAADISGEIRKDITAANNAEISVEDAAWTAHNVSVTNNSILKVSGKEGGADTSLHAADLNIKGLNTASVAKVKISGAELKITGSISGKNYSDLSFDKATVTAADIKLEGPGTALTAADSSVTSEKGISLSGSTVSLNENSKLTLNSGTLSLNGASAVSALKSNINLGNGSLDIADADSRVTLADNSALNAASVALSGGKVSLNNSDLSSAGDITLNGSAEIAATGEYASVSAAGRVNLSGSGSVVLTDGAALTAGSVVVNSADASVRMQDKAALNADSVSLIHGNVSLQEHSSLGSKTLSLAGDAKLSADKSDVSADKVNISNSASLNLNNGSKLTAYTVSGSGNTYSFNIAGSELEIKGDGNKSTTDLSAKVNASAGSVVNLNQASDTVGLYYNSDAKIFGGRQDYQKIHGVEDGSQIIVKADVSDLNIDILNKDLAEKLKNTLGEGNIFISATGVDSDIKGDYDESIDRNVVDFDSIASGNEIDQNYDTDDLREVVLGGVNADSKITGGWGAVMTDTGVDSVTVKNGGTLKVYKAVNGTLIGNKDLKPVAVNIENKGALHAEGSGKIGAVTGKEGTFAVGADADVTLRDGADTTYANADVGTLNNAGKLTAMHVTAENLNLGEDSELHSYGVVTAANINAVNATLSGGTVKLGKGTVAGSALNAKIFNASGTSFDGSTISAADIQLTDTGLNAVTISGEKVNIDADALTGSSVTSSDTLTAGRTLNLTAASSVTANRLNAEKGLNVNGNSSVKASELNVTSGDFVVGAVGTSGSRGSADIGALSLNGNTLLAAAPTGVAANTVLIRGGKPQSASGVTVLFAGTEGDSGTAGNPVIPENKSFTELDGDIVIGANSALGISDEEAAFRNAMAKFANADGSMKQTGNAYAFIDKTDIRLGDNKLIVGRESVDTLKAQQAKRASVYLGTDSVMEFSAKAINNTAAGSAVFSDLGEDKYIASKEGTIYIPAGMQKEDLAKLFGNKVKLEEGNVIKIQTENGLFSGVIDSSDDLHGTGDVEMEISPDAKVILKDVSDPTFRYLTNVMSSDTGYHENEDDFNSSMDSERNPQPEAVAVLAAADTTTPDNGSDTTTGGSVNNPAYGSNGIAVIKSSNGYSFIQDATGSNPGAIERSGRLIAFGGSAQIAGRITEMTAEALAERSSFTAGAGKNMTAVAGAQGSSFWITPVFSNNESDGLSAEGLKYGADADIYGFSAGYDFTMDNTLRIGAAFGFGGGDSAGNGAAAGVNNDFSYFGGSLYAAVHPVNNLSLGADLGYYTVDNDVEASVGVTGYNTMKASADTSVITAGVTGQYEINAGTVKITPHAGVRFNHISVDDYDVMIDGSRVAHTTGGSASYFSVPVGVKFSTDIKSGGWNIRPEAGLRASVNLGDREINSRTGFDGVLGSEINYNTGFMDSVTYGADLGLEAQHGNFNVGIKAGYTGSSNTDDLSLKATAEMKF